MTKRQEALLEDMKRLGLERDTAADQVDTARRSLARKVRSAHQRGIPVIVIAEAAGLSRQQVYNIVGEEQAVAA